MVLGSKLAQAAEAHLRRRRRVLQILWPEDALHELMKVDAAVAPALVAVARLEQPCMTEIQIHI